jgi:hypothetical protein
MGSSLCRVPHTSLVVSTANGSGAVHRKLLPTLLTEVRIRHGWVVLMVLVMVVTHRQSRSSGVVGLH